MQSKTLEHLSAALCNWLLTACDSNVSCVKVQIDKPAAISLADSATVVAKRSRSKSTKPSERKPLATPVSPAETSSPPSLSKFDLLSRGPKTIYDAAGIDFVGMPQLPLSTKSTKPEKRPEDLYYIALGSNLGDRAQNIHKAIDALRKIGNVRLVSFLYETPAAYVIDQPAFLNCALSLDTSLEPRALLSELKRIEVEVGRTPSIRYGPRLIDLDIVFNGTLITREPDLHIPHALMHERAFVVVPLLDICPLDLVHPVLNQSLRAIFEALATSDICAVRRAVPIPSSSTNKHEKVLYVDRRAPAYLLGIINATPDSFSDGNQHLDPVAAYQSVLAMLQADQNTIIDVGGESTAPGRPVVSEAEELSRVEPILQKIGEWVPLEASSAPSLPALHRPIVSIDTTKSAVASRAFALGADILNDVYAVSRFYLDRNKHQEMAELIRTTRHPWIIMHCRGTSSDMKELANYDEGRVVDQVVQEMLTVIKSALELGVLPWQIIIDPGIGFAKSLPQNAEILGDLARFKSQLGQFPLLAGASRKRFLSIITKTEDRPPAARDTASLALIGPMIASGANFVRVHDVPSSSQVKLVHESIYQQRQLAICSPSGVL